MVNPFSPSTVSYCNVSNKILNLIILLILHGHYFRTIVCQRVDLPRTFYIDALKPFLTQLQSAQLTATFWHDAAEMENGLYVTNETSPSRLSLYFSSLLGLIIVYQLLTYQFDCS